MSVKKTYDILPETKEYTIGNRDYVMYEPSGKSIRIYRNAQAECRVYGPDGKLAALKDIAGLESLLVSLVLHDEETNKPVPQSTIESWPHRIQEELYKDAKELADYEQDNSEKNALKAALAAPGCPVDAEKLQDFILSLEGEKYEAIQKWALTEPEDKAKN
jgi:hypothetical protein